MANTLPVRNSSGNSSSAIGSGSPRLKMTSVMEVAWSEKTEKLTPPGTTLAPKGNGFAGADAVPAHLVGRVRVDAQDLLGPGLAHRAALALALAAAATASPVSKKSRKPVADMTNRTSSLTP